MHSKSFTLGLGAGIILISIVFYAGLSILKPTNSVVQTEVRDYTDDEIRQKAKSMGMIAISELPDKTEKIEISDDEIIKRAEALGYVLPAEEPNIDDENEDPKQTETVSEENNTNTKSIYLRIPAGSNSKEIANMLFKNNIIDDVAKFNDYVTKAGKTKTLKAGNYNFSTGMKYEDVLKMLTTNQ